MTLERIRRRRWLVIGLLGAIAVALVAGGILLLSPRDEAPPDGPPPAAIAPDLIPLVLDGTIREADLHHDSREVPPAATRGGHIDAHRPADHAR